MIEKAYFCEKPSEILYAPCKNGTADVWLRKNIEETEDGYRADEVYMQTRAAKDEIESDFDRFYQNAAATGNKTYAERLSALENENAVLREQLSATMSAVDFILFGEG